MSKMESSETATPSFWIVCPPPIMRDSTFSIISLSFNSLIDSLSRTSARQAVHGETLEHSQGYRPGIESIFNCRATPGETTRATYGRGDFSDVLPPDIGEVLLRVSSSFSPLRRLVRRYKDYVALTFLGSNRLISRGVAC
jgi:hypothetical protein